MLAQCDSLYNVENNWSIDDLFDAHEALDIQDEAQSHAMQQGAKQ